MIEEWRDIVGYEGLYQVSNLGRVKSLWFNKERIMKPAINSAGYYSLVLHNHGIKTSHLVHRLVAKAFLPNNYNYPIINHIDENKINNITINLEWCDVNYNNNHGSRNHKISIALAKKVIGISLDGKSTIIANSACELDSMGFDHSSIAKCCRGIRKLHKGFTWRYEL